MQRFSKRTQRWIAALLAAIFLGASAWLAVRVGKPMTQLVRDSDQLRAWLDALGGALTGTAEISTLCAADPHTCNTFENPHAVRPVRESRPFASGDTIRLPAASVVSVHIAR